MTCLNAVEEIQDGGRLVRRKTTILSKIKSKSSFIGVRKFSSLYLKYKVIFSFPQEKLIKLLVTNAIDHRCEI